MRQRKYVRVRVVDAHVFVTSSSFACAANFRDLRDVGLVSIHAYSVLGVSVLPALFAYSQSGRFSPLFDYL